MKTFIATVALIVTAFPVSGQTNYDYDRIVLEQLDRGVVAVPHRQHVIVSWRTLRTDQNNQPFDVYRNGTKLNDMPLTGGGTVFTDSMPLAGQTAVYEVRGGGVNGSFTLHPDAPEGYLPVRINKPDDGYTPDGRRYTYSANDASVGDVDGDGQYEIFLKWEPSNAHDNAHDGFTGPVFIDCYRLPHGGQHDDKSQNPEQLWRINLGPNIRAGAHYTQFMVYDFDGDGRAEMMVKTADGTRDGRGHVIGDSLADYREGASEDRRTPLQGRILKGPEYISVFNGLTGEVMDTKPYVPQRGNLQAWGDNRGNRSERYLAAVGYLGNTMKASAIFCRGYYTRTVIAAWDWDGQQLTNRWTFDTDSTEWHSYAGQGNHNLRVADVDGDGFDEITYGSMCVDHDGRGRYNTGFGHGDAIHLLADPETNRLYIWDCHENRRDGSDLRDASTGEVVFQIKSRTDVGRAMAADIDPTNPGMEMWSTDSHGIRNMKGGVVSTASDASDPQHDNSLVLGGRYLPVNFGIWWDDDLLRELLDRETVYKYNWKQKSIDKLQRFEGVKFNNGTKSNPCLCADILGDWREEVIARNPESTELRIFVTPYSTPFRINCLMHDIPYRISVATQNVGYNQPAEPGFYLGPDRTDYLK